MDTMKTPYRRSKNDPWEKVLTSPLSPQSSYQFLQQLRKLIMRYLLWATRDLAKVDTAGAAAEIQRAADRLKTIAAMTPAAISAPTRR